VRDEPRTDSANRHHDVQNDRRSRARRAEACGTAYVVSEIEGKVHQRVQDVESGHPDVTATNSSSAGTVIVPVIACTRERRARVDRPEHEVDRPGEALAQRIADRAQRGQRNSLRHSGLEHRGAEHSSASPATMAQI